MVPHTLDALQQALQVLITSPKLLHQAMEISLALRDVVTWL